uniref:Metalloendopeptidase n=1 Tax=Parastrongyloides trichosuri TaxID=131310 RepID=A0A0N4Z7J6_PARTI
MIISSFGDEKKKSVEKRTIFRDSFTPWTFPIKYYIESSVNKENVKLALSIIENGTCITFQESSTTLTKERGIVFKWSQDTCASNFGSLKINEPNFIYLAYGCQKKIGLIIHEIGHSLGLLHEQQRPDRDDYISVDFNNIKQEAKIGYELRNISVYLTYLTEYDYGSVMHYKPFDFSINSTSPIITPKNYTEYSNMMGQHYTLSFNDKKKLNLCHCNKCNWVDIDTGLKNKTYKGIKCVRDGYPDFRNCSRCICPYGFIGNDCNAVKSNPSGCNSSMIIVANETFIHDSGVKRCVHYIQTFEDKLLKITIEGSKALVVTPCLQGFGHEVKYRKDWGAVGLLFCGEYKNKTTIVSEKNDALILYNGLGNDHFINISVDTIDKKVEKTTVRRRKKKSKKSTTNKIKN